jgi:hypothetical protein
LLSLVDEALLTASDHHSPACFLSLALRYGSDLSKDGRKLPLGLGACQALRSQYYKKAISFNNGIKQQNVSNMCKPIGVDVARLEEDHEEIFRALNTLSSRRGVRAHTFASTSAEEVLYPSEARDCVEQAIRGLPTLIAAIRSSILPPIPDPSEEVPGL